MNKRPRYEGFCRFVLSAIMLRQSLIHIWTHTYIPSVMGFAINNICKEHLYYVKPVEPCLQCLPAGKLVGTEPLSGCKCKPIVWTAPNESLNLQGKRILISKRKKKRHLLATETQIFTEQKGLFSVKLLCLQCFCGHFMSYYVWANGHARSKIRCVCPDWIYSGW